MPRSPRAGAPPRRPCPPWQHSLQDTKFASRTERDERGISRNQSLTYGEVEFGAFAAVLRRIPCPGGGRFVDLGSGSGRAVFVVRCHKPPPHASPSPATDGSRQSCPRQARAVRDFDRYTGIELLAALHDIARIRQRRFERAILDLCPLRGHALSGSVRFVCASLLDVDWSDADVVFCNSTCFSHKLMRHIGRQARFLKPGAHVVTFTVPLPSPCFAVRPPSPTFARRTPSQPRLSVHAGGLLRSLQDELGTGHGVRAASAAASVRDHRHRPTASAPSPPTLPQSQC